jgi:hypothetical protein
MNQTIHDHGENDPIEFDLGDAYKTVARFAMQAMQDNVHRLNAQDKRREELMGERELVI